MVLLIQHLLVPSLPKAIKVQSVNFQFAKVKKVKNLLCGKKTCKVISRPEFSKRGPLSNRRFTGKANSQAPRESIEPETWGLSPNN